MKALSVTRTAIAEEFKKREADRAGQADAADRSMARHVLGRNRQLEDPELRAICSERMSVFWP